jgi:probable F420-dependent oxidoreductase
MKVGVAATGSMADVARTAAAAESAGLESVWVLELTRSAFISAAAAIAATTRTTIGTGVALAFPRSPTLAAMEAWDLDELSGGRFVLGLGTQVKRVLENRFSVPFEPPAAKLVEYAQVMRTVWAANRGEPVQHEGRFYRVTMPTFHGPIQSGRPDVPILFAAVGAGMCRAAGATADGVVGHPLASPRYLAEVMAPAVAEGSTAAGRAPADCPIGAAVITAVGRDAAEARRAARLQIAFYATTRTYGAILELHGRSHIQLPLRRAFVRRDHDAMAALVDDELLDAIAVAGSPDELQHRLAAWAAVPGLERVVLSPPWYGVTEVQTREFTAAALDAAPTEGATDRRRSRRS